LRPFAANFCFRTGTDSKGEGKLFASEACDMRPSLRPVGTFQLGPSLCHAKYTYSSHAQGQKQLM